ncbi:MAG: response regulator transcription factor, partial [Dehalococcoidia bacterium]
MTGESGGYPDDLTPAERRVFDHVRAGTLDAETAVRLGIPIGDVKERVASILRKTGMRERAELVTWRPGPAAAEAPAGTEAAPGMAASQEEPLRGRRGLQFVLAGVALAAAIAAVVLFAGGGVQDEPVRAAPGPAESILNIGMSASDTAAVVASLNGYTFVIARGAAGATPGAEAAPTKSVGGIEAQPFAFEAAAIPRNMMLIAATGCPECGERVTSLMRMWWDSRGTLHQRTVFDALGYGQAFTPYIESYAATSDATHLAVALCTKGICGLSGPESEGAEITIVRSLNGGATWFEDGTFPGDATIVGLSAQNGILIGRPVELPASVTGSYSYYPGARPAPAPGPSLSPIVIGGAGTAWAADRGAPLFLPGAVQVRWLTARDRPLSILPGLRGGFHIAWTRDADIARLTHSFAGFIGDDGELKSAAWSPYPGLRVAGLIDNSTLVGIAGVPIAEEPGFR